MEPTPAKYEAFPLRWSRLNCTSAGELYWPTAAEYLAELRARAGEYERKARRRQRLTFDEARDLRRLLACLADVDAGRERLSTVDRSALDDAGGRLRQALADLVKLEGLELAPLMAEVRQRFSPAWCGLLVLCARDLEEQTYARVYEHAHYFTAKARAQARLTLDEVDTLWGVVFSHMIFEAHSPTVAEGDRRPTLKDETTPAYERLARVVPVLASRFGLDSAGFMADFERRGFWNEFRQRAEEAMKKSNEQPGEDTLEQAIRTLLRSVPETWTEYDPAVLNEPRERGLFLLVAAGMVERRSSFRLRMFGHPVAVEATFTVTGEYGGVEALRPMAASMWEQWGHAWQAKKGPTKDAFHCERIGREQWRLTTDGIDARADLEGGKGAVVFDFVLKRGFFDGRPRLMPDGQISQRGPVRGKGALEKLELVKADAPGAGPAGVSIANWADGGKAFADAFAGLFAMMQAKTNAPTSTEPPVTYTVAAVQDMAGVSATTLNEYAKVAGVKTPGRGKRNHRYSADEVLTILQHIIAITNDGAMKQRCQDALAKL